MRRLLSVSAILAGLHLSGCRPPATAVDILSRTVIEGNVNGAPFAGTVTATLKVGRGGSSECTFTQLPDRFTPATLGTHT